MARPRSRDLTVGVMFALAVIILAIAVMTVGAESSLFSDRVYYYAKFPTTTGLGIGSAVEMSGVQIGTVTRIRLPTDPTEYGIEVQLGVDKAYEARIRSDSKALLRVLMYLTGEKGVEITPGSPEEAPLSPESELALGQEIALFEQIGEASSNLTTITVSLGNLLQKLESGEGLLGQMINDPEFGKQGLDALRGTLENLEALTGEIRGGRGFAGRLLTDEDFGSRIDDLGTAIQEMAGLMESLGRREGALGALLEDGGAGENAIDDLRDAAGSLKRFAAGLESGDGLLAKLVHDEAFADEITGDLRRTLRNAAEITDKINSGDGSLGALVNERALHDSLEDFATGVNDSKFARWLLRHYQKKGIKEQSGSSAGNDDSDNEE